MSQLFHVYIGTKYQGPSRGNDAEHAIRRYAIKTRTSVSIYNAKPAKSVKEMKEPKPTAA